MKKILFISSIFLLILICKSLAIDESPLHFNISNSTFNKIDSPQLGLDSLVLSGKYKVAIVDKSGKYYSSPVAAMNDLDAWCGTPSAENPCLVKILPGIYDIGTNTLEMKPYVDIEGSGEKVTIIRGSSDDNSGTLVTMSSHTEIRFLTVENTGGGNYSVAISSPPALEVKITNVRIIVSGGTTKNIGFSSITHLMPPLSSIRLTNVTINISGNATNYGVLKSIDGSFNLNNVTISVIGGNKDYGVATDGGTTIDGSTIKAETSIYNLGGTPVGVINTMIDGSVSGPGTTKCAGVYDENFTFYANTCP
jgi:small nuclear ribonucleoprotein (snRNP)-like protein